MNKNSSQPINLSDLTKIPDQELKQYFRDWMERDDVARSLQAKLRKDLIENFNKTSLGKKIISVGTSSQRLTLSPLVLALHTLVAEFLYHENCHFSLSVFCTEVPYRNILPDFESSRHFRFTETEVLEILEALSLPGGFDVDTKQSISKDYSDQSATSLLSVIVRNIFEKRSTADLDISPDKLNHREQESSKAELDNINFRNLNRYLIVLSKKVKEMALQFENLQKRSEQPKQRKSFDARKYENLNRSLERISENLRQLSVSRRKNKRITGIVMAVDAMAKQFEKCAAHFESISKGFSAPKNEKSYLDWVNEMRSSGNGQKFLDRIGAALGKALIKQKQQTEIELEQKLRKQTELVKLKYKRKFTEQLAKLASKDDSEYARKLNESVENKLIKFEERHHDLLRKIHAVENEARAVEAKVVEPPAAPPSNISKAIETQTEATTTADNPPPAACKKQVVVNQPLQLQEIVLTIEDQEKHVDRIVFDAKLRIQELEYESKQLDQSFREYLERQKLEKKASRETATLIWNSYALGKSILGKNCAALNQPRQLNETGSREDFEMQNRSTIIDNGHQLDISIASVSPDKELDCQQSSMNAVNFENPFRVAQERVLSTADDSKVSKLHYQLQDIIIPCREKSLSLFSFHQQQQQNSCQLIEHTTDELNPIFAQEQVHTSTVVSNEYYAAKTTGVCRTPTPELNEKDEFDPTNTLSNQSPSSAPSVASKSPQRVFKLKRQLFPPVLQGQDKSHKINDDKQPLDDFVINAATKKKSSETTNPIKKGDTTLVLAQSLEKMNALFGTLNKSDDAKTNAVESTKETAITVALEGNNNNNNNDNKKETPPKEIENHSSEFRSLIEHRQHSKQSAMETAENQLSLSFGKQLQLEHHNDATSNDIITNRSANDGSDSGSSSIHLELSTGGTPRTGSSGSNFWE